MWKKELRIATTENENIFTWNYIDVKNDQSMVYHSYINFHHANGAYCNQSSNKVLPVKHTHHIHTYVEYTELM